MIDINLIRTKPDLVKENIKKKFQNEKLPLVDKIRNLDQEWKKLKSEEDILRKQRNEISRKINDCTKENGDASSLKEQAKIIPEKIVEIQEKRVQIQQVILNLMYKIPNIIHTSVPLGKDSSQNVELERIGEPKIPDYEIYNHAELAEKIGGADFESSRKTSGKGFFYLIGDIAELSSAIINFARDYMIKHGFIYIEPPFMIRSKVVEGVMSFEEIKNMMYKIEDEDLYLIGTSEHAIIGMFMDKTLIAKDIPYKITSYSPCFRKEIGAHGVDEKGFYRVHQFNKQEMVVICEPAESYIWYEKMLRYTIDIFRSFDIPVRVVECCSGDLADLKAKSCDVEAWSPKQKKYFEVGSLTNMEEAQARRLNIKIENSEGRHFAHTLNNTVVAVPRAIRFLIENNQERDGSVRIPNVLWQYMNNKRKIILPVNN